MVEADTPASAPETRPTTPAGTASVRSPSEVSSDNGRDERLVWIDLEMTGLDVQVHTIVEIAVLVTDGDLTIVDDGLDIVVHQPPDVLDRMDDFVRAMHTKSGLLPAIEASTVLLDDAGTRTVEYINAHVSDPSTAPVCGNSIGVDRRFLDHHLPALDRALHYRCIDVSSLKELCRRWYPQEYRRRPPKSATHRALDDIRESIEELRYYRSAMLKPVD